MYFNNMKYFNLFRRKKKSELPDAGLKLHFQPDTSCLRFINAFVYVVTIVCRMFSFLGGDKGKTQNKRNSARKEKLFTQFKICM